MAASDQPAILTLDGHEVAVTHPARLYFSRETQLSKLDLVRYYLAIAPGALQGIRNRPIVLKRFVNGACLAGSQPEPFYQKRAPADHPAFLRTVTLSFPSGRTAEELVVDNAPGLAWIVNLGCIELHPHAVRASSPLEHNLAHPDELRIDLDPNPGVPWSDVRTVALEVRDVLASANLTGWVKTSGSRGMHVNVRIHPQWTFTEVRRAALALAREVERRIPNLASSKWWKEERHGVFLDYNQNAKDRTTASAYSVRPLPDARVSAPITWDELPACDPADFTVLTMPARFAQVGDPHAAMDHTPGSLDALLQLAARDEASGLGDAPWPPHFARAEGEAKRVAPSRAKKSPAKAPSPLEASTPEVESTPKAFADQLSEGFGAQRFRRRATTKSPASLDSTAAEAPKTAVILSERSESKDPERSNPIPTAHPIPPTSPQPRKTRTPKHPLLTIAQSPAKSAAEAGLARWQEKYPIAAAYLGPDDILIDRMRGSSAIWYRIRINLRHVPETQRPPQTTPDPDDDPTRMGREA